MVNFGIAVDFGWCVWVVIGYFEFEFVCGVFPVAGIGCDGYFKDGEVVGIGEVDVGYFSTVEFGNVCGWNLVRWWCYWVSGWLIIVSPIL